MFRTLSQPGKTQAISAGLIVIVGLIIITPLCGALFHCHCDWPWLRFYFACNYFDAHAIHKCPWCASGLAGFVSITTTFILAVLAPLILKPTALSMKAIAIKVIFGLTIFILVATLSGALSAYTQQYPLGIGDFYTDKGT